MGERNYISTTAAFLAEALYRQERDEEAFRMTEESEEIAAADDVATQYLWRSVRAKLIARRGRHEEAESHGRRGDPDHRGRPGPRLAGLRLPRPERGPAATPGRPADAIVAAETAVARFELKGNSSSAGRARAAADALRAAAALPG